MSCRPLSLLEGTVTARGDSAPHHQWSAGLRSDVSSLFVEGFVVFFLFMICRRGVDFFVFLIFGPIFSEPGVR